VKDPTQRLGSLARGEREIFEQGGSMTWILQALRGRDQRHGFLRSKTRSTLVVLTTGTTWKTRLQQEYLAFERDMELFNDFKGSEVYIERVNDIREHLIPKSRIWSLVVTLTGSASTEPASRAFAK
jgi:hypothetical protein